MHGERATVLDRWRRRADELDADACRMRRVGDRREAMDAEAAATEYRIAADELEAGS